MQRMAFFLVLFSLYSCQPLDVEDSEAGTIPQIGDEAWESRALTSDEIQLARKFCRALESKEIAYRRDYLGQDVSTLSQPNVHVSFENVTKNGMKILLSAPFTGEVRYLCSTQG